jgi:16S rRNA (adenine1518-N6/adenine1519-N6)-dimethyltransferase
MKRNQIFLNDEQTLKLIAEKVSGRILEVGGGHGELTKHLVDKGSVVVVELNRRLAERIKIEGVKVVLGDALKQSFDEYDFIVGNIPYDVSSQIIIKFLNSSAKKAIFTIQKELADRLIAKPGSKDYSKLSVNVQNTGNCKILKVIPPEFFSPKPKVYSAVIEIEKNRAPVLNSDSDKKIVDLIFQHKNQNIGKVLKREGFKITDDPVFLKKGRNIEINEIKKISDLVTIE